MAERETDVPGRDKLWESVEDGSFSFFFWGRFGYASTLRQRIAEKDGDDGKVAAAGSSSEREQVGGGDSKQPKGEDRIEMKKRQSC